MVLKRILFLWIFFHAGYLGLFAQTEEENPDIITQTIERIAEQSEEEKDYSELNTIGSTISFVKKKLEFYN